MARSEKLPTRSTSEIMRESTKAITATVAALALAGCGSAEQGNSTPEATQTTSIDPGEIAYYDNTATKPSVEASPETSPTSLPVETESVEVEVKTDEESSDNETLSEGATYSPPELSPREMESMSDQEIAKALETKMTEDQFQDINNVMLSEANMIETLANQFSYRAQIGKTREARGSAPTLDWATEQADRSLEIAAKSHLDPTSPFVYGADLTDIFKVTYTVAESSERDSITGSVYEIDVSINPESVIIGSIDLNEDGKIERYNDVSFNLSLDDNIERTIFNSTVTSLVPFEVTEKLKEDGRIISYEGLSFWLEDGTVMASINL